MRAPLPEHLPVHLPDYAPGRITVVPEHAWPLPESVETAAVRIELPRYAMDLRTLVGEVDPDRVRWLTERTTVRPLDARHVHLVAHRRSLHVVDGHHALAAHLITGAERIPARLFRAVEN